MTHILNHTVSSCAVCMHELFCFFIWQKKQQGLQQSFIAKCLKLKFNAMTMCVSEIVYLSKETTRSSTCRHFLVAVEHLCFTYTDSTIPLLGKSKISSVLLFFTVTEQTDFCLTRSNLPKTGFLASWLIS